MKGKVSYTRYEKTRIVASRALQIAQGSPILTKVPKGVTDPIEIAQLEWEAEVIPIDVKVKDEKPVDVGRAEDEEEDTAEEAEEKEEETESE